MLPLRHIKIIELAGLAPVPLCGLLLSDFGAQVIRVDNVKQVMTDEALNRGKKSIHLDLKQAGHVDIFKKLIKTADVLLDPYRPGVLERLALSPGELHRDNPRLIIARLTGYGQPHASDPPAVASQKRQAGHDINYIALSGILSRLGSSDSDRPHAPLNIVADFAGGGLLCAMAIVMALMSRQATGRGEVIDCSMTLGSAYLCSFLWTSRRPWAFMWPQPGRRGANLLDGGAPFYRCYRTRDDKFVAVGAIEPHFYRCFLQLVGIPETEAPQLDSAGWPDLAKRVADAFASGTQDEWIARADVCGDCCVTRVLDLDEAARFWGRRSFSETSDAIGPEPLPHPLFASGAVPVATKRPVCGGDTEAVLLDIGLSRAEIANFMATLRGRL